MAKVDNPGIWEKIQKNVQETERLMGQKKYNQTMIKARQTLEYMVKLKCDQAGIVESSLDHMIHELYDGQWISKSTAEHYLQILSIGNQTSGKCSWYALRYARTILDGKVSSGSGMWSNGAVWSAGGYYGYSGSLSECLQKLYTELSAGKPVIVHLKNTAVSGVKRHTNRTSSYEYHLTSSGWNEVNYPHIATSAAYGHWVCVVGIRADADPANLKESDFYALDPARVSANGTLAVTRLLDGTIWTDNSPLKTAG